MTTLTVEALTVWLGRRRALVNVFTTWQAGEIVGLIGPNGAGKTTLLRACAGLITSQRGAIRIDGQPIRDIARRDLACMLGYLPQQATCHWPLEVERLVALGRLPHLAHWQRPSGQDAAAIAAALDRADVRQFVGRNVLALSGGERARVLLARALAVEPRFLLADEPCAGLDPEHQLRTMNVLRDLARAGTGVAVTMHDLGLAARFCDRLVLLRAGERIADGTPQAVLTKDTLASVFRIHAEINQLAGRPNVVPLHVVNDAASPAMKA